MTNREKIINEAKRIEEDSLYSSKGHFYAGQCWTKVNLWLGSISAVLSAIAGASALSQFDYHNIVAGSLSIIVAGLTAIIAFINPKAKVVCDKQRFRPRRSEVMRLYGDNSKIKKLTNWKQGYSLNRGLKETIKWFSNRNNNKGYKANIYNV